MSEPGEAPAEGSRADPGHVRLPLLFAMAAGAVLVVALGPDWLGTGTHHHRPFGRVAPAVLEMALAVALVLAASSVALWRTERSRLALRRENDHLRALAALDPMTMLGNRRSFDEALPKAWRAAARARGPLSLVLLDADHFKRFNDRFGHLEGDRVLRTLASVLATELRRPDDRAFRIGGEEFALLLPGTDAAGAAHVGTAVRAGIARSEAGRDEDDGRRVTVSMGIAQARPDAGRPGDARSLFAAADRALYEAKAAGRDRIRVAALLLPTAATAAVTGAAPSLIDGVEILLGNGRAIRVGRPIGVETLRAVLELLVGR